jgi:hydroxymethylglutaryl-CoA lyase
VRFPKSVRIVDVGPRDGLQNEPGQLDVATRVGLIERLAAAGVPAVEAGSFVSPKWVPQMAASGEVLRAIHKRPGVAYPVLTPNLQGFEAALDAGAREVAIFAAASESFSQKNINCSIQESLERFQPLCLAAKEKGVRVRGYVSCVLGCPYEGQVAPSQASDVARRLLDLGCYEISLGDTIGTGTPSQARAMIEEVSRQVPVSQLAAHFHDTYGQALANLLAVMDLGVATIDSSVAGLGGCPYAKGASGNVATEDVLYMLNGLGVETGIDLGRVAEAGRFICRALGRETASKAARALGG